jgi:hypothetical protein
MPPSRTTERLIKNAIDAWQACGLDVGAVEVLPGGGVRILAPASVRPLPSSAGRNTCDALFGEESD